MHSVNYSLRALPRETAQIVSKDEGYVRRAWDKKISLTEYKFLKENVKFIGVSGRFRHVIDLFKVPEGETPMNFTFSFRNLYSVRLIFLSHARRT